MGKGAGCSISAHQPEVSAGHLRFNLILFVLVLEIRILWVGRDEDEYEDEYEDDDEVGTLYLRMDLHENNIGFS
jgi:hypothetical protein